MNVNHQHQIFVYTRETSTNEKNLFSKRHKRFGYGPNAMSTWRQSLVVDIGILASLVSSKWPCLAALDSVTLEIPWKLINRPGVAGAVL